MRIIRQWIMDILGFSKSEANGTLILILLILSLAVFPRIYFASLAKSGKPSGLEAEMLSKWSDEVKASLVAKATGTEIQKELQYSPFNPNTASLQQLTSLGFPERAAKNLVNYRESGGSFQTRSDLKKIYGLSKSVLNKLWKYIELPEEKVVITVKPEIKPPVRSEPVLIDLNSASAAELRKIKGIGPVLSERIIKFRNRLGGFYSSEQLADVYGLKPETLEAVKKAVYLSGTVKKIYLNTDSAEHLYRHPYVEYAIANALVNYRSHHGNFDALEDIKAIKIISDSLYQKIYPYLSLYP